MKKSEFNHHPEMKPGEIFLKWCFHSEMSQSGNACFHMYPYDTMRLGTVAYDENRFQVPRGIRPVYVDRKEILQTKGFVAISMDGQIVPQRKMRSNVERNLEESRQARMARIAAAPRF